MSVNVQVLKVLFLTGEQDFSEEDLITLKVRALNGDYLLLEGFEKLEQVISLCLGQIEQQSIYQVNFRVEFDELEKSP